MIKFLTTDEFWEAMCDSRFYRVSLKQGVIGEDILLVEKAPEEIEGFFEQKIDKFFTKWSNF